MAGRDPNARLVAYSLAAGVPLACYLATASGWGYWFDAGEFVAQATDLDISHPPGHPLFGVLTYPVTLLPLGPLSFRVALASALFAALAAAFLFRAVETTVSSAGVESRWIATPLAIGATWLVAGSQGWWFQAVRPEVYALQAALVFIAIERVVALEHAGVDDVRPMYVACLCVGLALANHHFLAVLLLPALAPTFARVRRAAGNRALLTCAGFGAAGLATYAYLPARTAAGVPLGLGQPDSLERIYWVVSAQAFQKNTASEFVAQPLGERVLDVTVQLFESLHVIPVLLALAGLWALARTAGPGRRVAWVWGAVLFVFFAARAWLGFVRSNPDALGYLMPALGAVGALAAAFVAAVLRLVAKAGARKPSRITIALAIAIGAAGLAQLYDSGTRATLAGFFATDAFEEPGRRDLPADAVVLVHSPQTVFRYWGGEAAERLRPDVTLIAMPFLAYPEMVDHIVARTPEVAPLLRGYLLDGELREGDLQSLAASQPVLVELDPRVPLELYGTLVAHGAYHDVLPDDAYPDDRRAGAEAHDHVIQWQYKMLGDARDEPETANQLLWHHYMSALFHAATGEREAARTSVTRGRGINPHAAELTALDVALTPDPDAEEPEEGPLDVLPFMPGGLE